MYHKPVKFTESVKHRPEDTDGTTFSMYVIGKEERHGHWDAKTIFITVNRRKHRVDTTVKEVRQKWELC